MSQWSTVEYEGDDEHTDTWAIQDQWEESVLVLEQSLGIKTELDEATGEVRELVLDPSTGKLRPIGRLVARKPICSCGHYYCGMIGHYGLPLPTYQQHIEPLPDQYQKDRLAAKLHE